MSNKKPIGRPSQKDKELLLIQVKDKNGKTKSKQFRSPTFDFDKVVDGVKLIIKE